MPTKTPKSPFRKETYLHNAEIYRILANPKRLEILNILEGGETSVEELIKALKNKKANVSQHLAVLRKAKLVTVRKQGLNVFYNLIDPRVVKICRTIKNVKIKERTIRIIKRAK